MNCGTECRNSPPNLQNSPSLREGGRGMGGLSSYDKKTVNGRRLASIDWMDCLKIYPFLRWNSCIKPTNAAVDSRVTAL